MKLFNFLKAAKDVLIGSEVYENGDDSTLKSEVIDDSNESEDFVYISHTFSEKDDDCDDKEGLTEADVSLFERDRKSTKKRQRKNRNETRDTIIEMLRRYDTLTEDEKCALTDCESPLYLGNLKKSDSRAVGDVVNSWYVNKVIDEEKCDLFDCISSSEVEQWFPIFSIGETPLTEADYKQLIVLYNYDTGTQELHYKELADYCKRYWFHSGNKPQPIDTDDLLVNRPCYMITNLKLCTPRFHLGKRYFEDDDSFQNVKVYLFADKLEYICDGGHMDIYLKYIIDISINDWNQIAYRWEQIKDWREREQNGNGNTKPCPEKPEPELLEITCSNNHKLLFTDLGNNSELLILRALMFYLIKKPQ